MKNLKDARKHAKMTQQQVADVLGIERPSYARYESSERQPDMDTLIKLADTFNVTTDYLLGRTDNPQFEQPETIAARHSNGKPPVSKERLDEIIAQAVAAIKKEAGV